MSDMLDNILTRNFLHLGLDDAFLPAQPHQHKAPGSRLNRSASYFSSPPSPPSSSASSSSSSSVRHSLSTEHINNTNTNDDEDGGSSCVWPSDIWSQVAASKPQQLPFRPDRSMSLTESASSALLSSLGQLGGLESSSSSCSPPGSAVAPPPGFPPLSSSLQCQTPMTILPSNRYKTELCRGYQESGSCKYGSKCQFAHGEAELRGLYRHPKYKTEPCRTFYNFGYCPYGARCHFIHEEKAAGGPLAGGAKFQQTQRQQAAVNAAAAAAGAAQNPRHQIRHSVSFAGFLASRGSPPPSLPSSSSSSFNNDPNLGFSRAPSVSPPPADLLSPVFGGVDALQREAAAFQFGGHHHHHHHHQARASTGDIHNIPLIVEPKPSRCVCGHGNGFPALSSSHNNNSRGGFASAEEDGHRHHEAGGLFHGAGGGGVRGGGFMKAPALQRFSSEDSLEDSYSSSSGGSSGTESPTFDGSAGKRLTVFARLSLSD